MRAVEALAIDLAREGLRLDRAFTSPLRRAKQTATLVVHRLAPELRIELMPELATTSDPEDVLRALHDAGVTHGHVLLVGHQPLVARLVSHLCDQPEPAFPAGCLIRIECSGAPGRGDGRVAREWRPA
jgi:phosphohistidine phosphatase SixA